LFSDLLAGYKLLASEPRPVKALYRGLGASVAGAVPTSLVYMPTYEAAKLCFAGTLLAPLSGVVTGLVSACVRVPTSVVKAQLQLGLHDSGAAAVRSIVRSSGLVGLFVGFRATVVLDVFYAVRI
jgi:solute carrier family 25 S-adenosylmethionine transporter 26